MSHYRILSFTSFASLAIALAATALPAQAQERDGEPGGFGQRTAREDVMDRSAGERPSNLQRSEWRAARQQQRETAPPNAAARASVATPARNSSYTAPRDGSYGASTRSDRSRDYGAHARRDRRGDNGADTRRERREDARESRQDYRQGYRAGRNQEWRDDRRDVREAYSRGSRAGDRSDHARSGHWRGRDGDRWDRRSWDRRSWRNDRRYDWYRYRALNRSIFSPGRYYAPYRGYRYSRFNIGIRIGSPFYSSRYWIHDPWQYRLPPAYGPYRWVRYYDDALLVDIYTGEVVDAIHDFFW